MGVLRHSAAAVAALAVAPVAAGALALRPAWRVGWRERLGRVPRYPPGAIWVHAASVGEILAALRLIDRLRKRGHTVVTSTVTLTGRAVMRQRRPEVPCRLAPLDHPWCVDAALGRVAPAALVLIETELWPCWIAAAERHRVPIALLSGRVSDRTYPRYRALGRWVGRTLARLRVIGARTPLDRERFIALGADPERVSVSGDLKLEVDPPRALAPDLERILGGAPLFVAGSTHAGEEEAALEALTAARRAGHSLHAALAPRHPERAREVERRIRQSGLRVRLRSEPGGEPLGDDEVLLVDTLGELASLYPHARLAFVGGSLVPVGGHNVLEPAFARCPVLYGPHTHSVRHAVEILEACGAGQGLPDADALAPALIEALRDPEAAKARGESGWQALQRHRGAAERAAELVDPILGLGSQAGA